MKDKFSIAGQLEIEKLNEKITFFICANNYYPYIFANKETLIALIKTTEQDLIFTSFDSKQTKFNGFIASYQGYKIFEDDTLNFGEIELR